jgi:hypothetical protein
MELTDALAGIWQNLLALVSNLFDLVVLILALACRYTLLIVWVGWWLLGVNWKKTWPVLAQGAWVPVVLLMIVVTLVWANLAPSPCNCLGFLTVPNGWWQLGSVSALVALALFCGWLQGQAGWEPPEIDLEPPAAASHDHEHH